MLGGLALGACGPSTPAATSMVWIAGKAIPRFDPDGPPNALRWGIERLLTRGLVAEDSSGRIVPDAAERFEVGEEGRLYTFHLRPGLAYVDGAPCTSADFAAALRSGLARTDHATRDWLLAAVRGVDRVRAGKPLPPIGVETPDPGTLTIRLARPDTTLLRKLALPGVSSPWSDRTPGAWAKRRGLGPYEVVEAEAERPLVLVRRGTAAGPDTLRVRFAIGSPRVRTLLRQGIGDLVWPVPPGFTSEALPAGYRQRLQAATPTRHLLLVMRADLPPTTKLAARNALAHGLNLPAILRSLGGEAREVREWFPGAGRLNLPRFDGGEVQHWMEQGKLGRSFHVNMIYDADAAGAQVARAMQGDWARYGIYVDLLPRRGEQVSNDLLTGLAHVALVAAQAPTTDPASQLAPLIMPLRGPAVGSFRTGWRTRAFDAWIAPGASALPAREIQDRLAEERVAIPLAELPWLWVEREGTEPAGFHPHFGPGITIPAGAAGVPPPPRRSR